MHSKVRLQMLNRAGTRQRLEGPTSQGARHYESARGRRESRRGIGERGVAQLQRAARRPTEYEDETFMIRRRGAREEELRTSTGRAC